MQVQEDAAGGVQHYSGASGSGRARPERVLSKGQEVGALEEGAGGRKVADHEARVPGSRWMEQGCNKGDDMHRSQDSVGLGLEYAAENRTVGLPP